MVTFLETLNLLVTLLILARVVQCWTRYTSKTARTSLLTFAAVLTALRFSHFLAQWGVPAELAREIQGGLGLVATTSLALVFIVAPPGAPSADVVGLVRSTAAPSSSPGARAMGSERSVSLRDTELCST